MARIDHDGVFKELLGEMLREFIEAFVPGLADVIDWSHLEKLDKETFVDASGRRRKVKDLVAKVRFQGEEAYLLIHVEHQAQRQSDFARRMFTYFARLHEKYELPVYPIVLCSYGSPHRPEPDHYAMTVADLPVLAFNFGVVQLNRLDWRDYIGRPNAAVSALMAKMSIDAADRPM